MTTMTTPLDAIQPVGADLEVQAAESQLRALEQALTAAREERPRLEARLSALREEQHAGRVAALLGDAGEGTTDGEYQAVAAALDALNTRGPLLADAVRLQQERVREVRERVHRQRLSEVKSAARETARRMLPLLRDLERLNNELHSYFKWDNPRLGLALPRPLHFDLARCAHTLEREARDCK